MNLSLAILSLNEAVKVMPWMELYSNNLINYAECSFFEGLLNRQNIHEKIKHICLLYL